ncbi:hypothetical protein [uncultured Microscilla sp.]|uniref:hypothetical protein n=1 Tax=uncultured Microscilla sp. TaxID=432653 RepID=UPI002604EF22|nr:hypothetical protein [uncultured Microscilla sp.]
MKKLETFRLACSEFVLGGQRLHARSKPCALQASERFLTFYKKALFSSSQTTGKKMKANQRIANRKIMNGSAQRNVLRVFTLLIVSIGFFSTDQ